MELEERGTSCVLNVSVAAEHGQETKVIGLTITPEKISRVMADVQAQIDGLQRDLIHLRAARGLVAKLCGGESDARTDPRPDGS